MALQRTLIWSDWLCWLTTAWSRRGTPRGSRPLLACREETMRTTLLAAAGVGVMMLLSHGFAAKAAEVKIIAAGPLTAVFKELGPQFERETGHTLATRFAATSVVKREIDAGETFDIAIS